VAGDFRTQCQAPPAATLQFPDGKEVTRPSRQAGINVHDARRAGYKMVGDKSPTAHIADKGKPMTVPAK